MKWLNSVDRNEYFFVYESLVDYINNKNIIDFRMENIELIYEIQSIPRKEQKILENNNYLEDAFIKFD